MPVFQIPSPPELMQRIKAALPLRWFPDSTPILDALLTGLATSWSSLFEALTYIQSQTRISTTSDFLLDVAAIDFFGPDLRRADGEGDAAFRARLQREFLRERGTREALIQNVSDATGQPAVVLEFARPPDTGAYGIALGYGAAGAWGNLTLPYQALVTTTGDATTVIARTLPVATIAWTQTT